MPRRTAKKNCQETVAEMPSLSESRNMFKDAFLLVDQDNDGWLSEHDLRPLLASLGISHLLDDLLAAAPGINLTLFLTMMRERLLRFDPETDLNDAFECFDDTDTGIVKVDEMRKWLADVGERMDPQEIDKFLKGFTDRQGNFNYREWMNVLRVNDDSS